MTIMAPPASESGPTRFTEPAAPPPAAPAGVPRLLLRLEGAAAFAGALVAYQWLGGSWLWFAGLFLVPDLSMLGYLAGPRPGAIAYNVVHTYLGPALLALAGLLLGSTTALQVAAIWAAHIGLDRALGYGLKYRTAFADTHLGRLGPI
ncbi:MAG: DUF4260 domain-containing protein [Rhodoplanes sp.]|uniref:DUF4260 domain-containing protein n=1 Tax=Rhodoplanes sp. TaxID=1968906 RepID=UPI0017B7F891|nr:DUF4260 domain-containing protein [Rhodoplanes sp.]NVO18016.1 DUF4260 domain-containing protein [Rhodoplanes sp.]